MSLMTRFPFVANEVISCDIKELFDLFFKSPSEDVVEEEKKDEESSEEEEMPDLAPENDEGEDGPVLENENENNDALKEELDN